MTFQLFGIEIAKLNMYLFPIITTYMVAYSILAYIIIKFEKSLIFKQGRSSLSSFTIRVNNS